MQELTGGGGGGDPNTLDAGSFKNCVFNNNSAEYGGAVCSKLYAFINCKFVSNSSLSGWGGAVECEFSRFTECTFDSNSSNGNSGAVHAEGNNVFSRCSFVNNIAKISGGAVSTQQEDFECCTFDGNNANHEGGAVVSCRSTLKNCSFSQNSSLLGGAIAILNAYDCNITNCVFTLNEASDNENETGRGGAIYCDIPLTVNDPAILRNCILWNNTATEGAEIYEAEKPLVITYSTIQGELIHAGTGNINTDPLFVNPDNNFHIRPSSPCIDTGTADSAPADDLDGNYRPVGSGYDMGAYEYQGPIVIDSFTATPTTGEPSLIVDFICTAHDDSDAITGYQWNFGDGNTDNSVTGAIQHTYIIPGTFMATCTVINDNNNQTTVSTVIEVTNDLPVADAGSDQIVPGNSVELDGSGSYDPDGTISSWEWTLSHTENSSYDKTASGEIVYLPNLEFGHYTVTLTVTDNFGAQGTDEMFLSIAGSTGDVYSQEDLDNARQDGHDQGYLEGMDEGLNNSGNTIAGIITEGANGEKIIEGPVIIKGTLIIE